MRFMSISFCSFLSCNIHVNLVMLTFVGLGMDIFKKAYRPTSTEDGDDMEG